MELPAPLQQHQPVVERELRALLEEHAGGGLPLYRMMQYQLGWVDESGESLLGPPPDRLYGALCLEAAATEGDPAMAGPAAAAAELLYHAVTVHQDVQMGDRHEGKSPAVWWSWGPAHAINVGDGLHALVRLGVFRLQAQGLSPERTIEAIRTLDASALRFYEGQFMELTHQERVDMTEAQYLELAEALSGSLFSAATALGALAGGAGDAAVAAIRRCGRRLGVAAHLHRDVSQLWGDRAGEAPPGRVLNKSKLLPVVHVLETGTLAQKRALGEAYFKRVMEREDVERVRGVLDDVGAREYTQEKAEAISREALEMLEEAGVSPEALDRWRTIGEYLVRA